MAVTGNRHSTGAQLLADTERAGLGLLVLGWVLAFFYAGHADPLFAPVLILIYSGVFCLVLPGFWRGWAVPRGAFPLLLLGFWLWLTASLFWSRHLYTSLLQYWSLSALPIVFFALQAGDRWTTEKMIRALQILATALAVWAFIQYAFMREVFGFRAWHPFTNVNNLAAFLSLGIFLALRRFWTAPLTGAFALPVFHVFVMILGFLCTLSRAGVAAFLVGFFVFAAFSSQNGNLRQWRRWLILFLVVAAAILCAKFFGTRAIVNLATELVETDRFTSATHRFSLWSSAIEIIRQYSPWLGTGLGTFSLFYQRMRPAEDTTSSGIWVHSDPLQFAVETGLVSVALFYAVLMAVLLLFLRSRRARATDTVLGIDANLVFAALLSFVLHAHADFHFHVLPLTLAVAVLLSHLHFLCQEGTSSAPSGRMTVVRALPPSVAAGLFALPFLALLHFLALAGLSTWHVHLAEKFLQRHDIERFSAAVARAAQLAPESYARPVFLAGEAQSVILRSGGAFDAPERQKEMYERGRALLEAALKKSPEEPAIFFSLAQLYLSVPSKVDPDAEVRGEEMLRALLAKNPRYLAARMRLAQIERARGNEAAAVFVLEQGMRWEYPDQDVREYYRTLQSLRHARGDVAGAQVLAERLQAMEEPGLRAGTLEKKQYCWRRPLECLAARAGIYDAN